jgi:hypothetical protein
MDSGAISVGLHILAYDGRDDKLFNGAIAESGATSGVGLLNANSCRFLLALKRIAADTFSTR